MPRLCSLDLPFAAASLLQLALCSDIGLRDVKIVNRLLFAVNFPSKSTISSKVKHQSSWMLDHLSNTKVKHI